MQEIIALDKEIFLYLNNLGNSCWDGFWSFISEKYVWIPFYAFLLFLLWKFLGWKQTLLVLVLTALLIISADQFTNILKDSIKRLRPCHVKEFEGLMRPIGCVRRGLYGFTSAHASNHFALALFLGSILRKQIPWLIYFLFIWAAVISYSRIYLGVHYPLDVVCGGLIGLLFSWIFYKVFNRLVSKYHLQSLDSRQI